MNTLVLYIATNSNTSPAGREYPFRKLRLVPAKLCENTVKPEISVCCYLLVNVVNTVGGPYLGGVVSNGNFMARLC